MKEFFQSPENRQQIKTVIIGLAVLVSTFSATLLTGWITSKQTASEEIAAPGIDVVRSGDFLEANSSQIVTDWRYVGPRERSTCDATVFEENFLGFGSTFKEGSRLRLDFYRDNDKYYCFRAVNAEGVSGYGSYAVNDLPEPIITFTQTKERLTADLSDNASRGNYNADNWQYVLLSGWHADCSATAFAGGGFSGRTVELAPSEADTYYCFHVSGSDGGAYQAKAIAAGDSVPIAISLLRSGARLYLLADQKIKNWAVAPIAGNDGCAAENFSSSDDYRLSHLQEAVINLDSAGTNEAYCLRAQNTAGIYSYETYDPNTEDLVITIGASFPNAASVRLAASTTGADISTWAIASSDSLNQCRDGEFGPNIISRQAVFTARYPSTIAQVYCWQADDGQHRHYAAYAIPNSEKLLATYRIADRITSHSIYPRLSNWQYVSRLVPINAGTDKTHCGEADFATGSLELETPSIVFTRVEQYCFRALDSDGRHHYGYWFTADLKINNPTVEDKAAILSQELGLSALGRYIFYGAQPKFHENEAAMEAACGFRARFSCYVREDGRIHIMNKEATEVRLQDLSENIAQAARWNYLSDEQRAVQNLELLIIYRQNKTYFDARLPGDFASEHFFEDDFLNDFHDFLMTGAETELARWQNSWQRWRATLFN